MLDPDKDVEVTKPGLSLTPQNIKELTDRGIAVNLPNEKQFLQGDSIKNNSWDIEPVFRRSMDMCEAWELEQVSKNKVLKAHKVDKKKFG